MKVFVDSNLWLYQLLEGQDEEKARRLRTIIYDVECVVVSTQVLVEIAANLVRKARLPSGAAARHVTAISNRSQVEITDLVMIQDALVLRDELGCSWWDALIIAAALVGGAHELWSEDLQHGRVVRERLRIRNPLLTERT